MNETFQCNKNCAELSLMSTEKGLFYFDNERIYTLFTQLLLLLLLLLLLNGLARGDAHLYKTHIPMHS